MSTAALMLAVRDFLRGRPELNLAKEQCEVTHKGRPFNASGDLFVGIWYGYWRDHGSNGQSLDTEHGVNVTVSVRATQIPQDKLGPEVIAKANVGLVSLCERINALVHMDPQTLTQGGVAFQAVMFLANEMIGKGANGFVEPLQFLDGGRPEDAPANWWGGKGGWGGLMQTLAYGKANRVQVIESQT